VVVAAQGQVTFAKQAETYTSTYYVTPQIQNFPIFVIESTRLTGSFEAFRGFLAQSAGELWLKALGKILAPKFWLARDLKS